MNLSSEAFCSGGEALYLKREALSLSSEAFCLNGVAIALSVKRRCWMDCDRGLDYCGILEEAG
ncbi:MAG: hypothetical protein WBA10_06425 [Elainellaceae cyanobacterium]